jgi:DNA-directed RNA polymerase specialized sigma24 family protein
MSIEDTHKETRNFAQRLEDEGHGQHEICDALFVTALEAGAKMSGPETVAAYLYRMADHYAAKADKRASPPTMTQ